MPMTTRSRVIRPLCGGMVAMALFAACVAEPGAGSAASAPAGPSLTPAGSPQSTSATSQDLAARLCSTAGASHALALGASTGVPIAAFAATAAEVASWQLNRDGPDGPRPAASVWSAQPPARYVAVCYYDGEFAVTRPPGAPAYERAILLVTEDGTVTLDRVGPRNAVPAVAPTP